MFSWKMLVMLVLLLFWDSARSPSSVAASQCPAECKCRWKSGKETVECISRGFTSIPNNIDSATQVLDLSGNNLQTLPKDTFQSAKLLNLQRIYLSNCHIGHIDECAFRRLTNLVELDLSHNRLSSVPSATFKYIPQLWRLVLSNNPIQRIDNNAFVSLNGSFSTLELSRCQIEIVAPKAFHGLKNMTNLKLDNNRLTSLSAKTIQPLNCLHNVDLHGNPWRCDCALQEVKVWLTRCKVPYTEPAMCAVPKRLHGMTLDRLEVDDLACQPQGTYSYWRLEAFVGYNASIVCQVTANPSPTVHWVRSGVVLANMSRFNQGRQQYVIHERGGIDKSSVLTITRATEKDAGHYVCVAENKAGRFSTNFTVVVSVRQMEASGLTGSQIAGISVGLLLVGSIVSLLICILLAKMRQSDRNDVIKHPPLNHSQHKLINSVNHVDHKGKSSNSVRMSFSFPKLSRSNSTNRNYSDEASDSDRTLIDNSASPSKSSACNLSTTKPDVVNVARSASSETSGRSKKDSRKKEKRQDRKQKEKRKERHRWKTNVSNDVPKKPLESEEPCSNVESTTDNKCNSVADSIHNSSLPHNNIHHHHQQQHAATTLPRSHNKVVDGDLVVSKKAITDDDDHYGSFGNLKLSSSSEWNKITSEMIENSGFSRDSDVSGLARESYELLEKTWDKGQHNNSSSTKTVSTIVIDDCVDGGGGGGGGGGLTRNSSRFRHYVPVLPPLPAQHYSQVRNSLIRTSKDEDNMDM